MTEADAKTKWCPFTRVGSSMEPGFAINRDAAGGLKTPELSRCIASACMAWRTRREASHYNAHGGFEDTPRIVGFCGLAGSPQ